MRKGYNKFVLAACCLVLISCSGTSDPDCRDETRALIVRADLISTLPQPQPGDTGTAHLSFFEARHFVSKVNTAREVSWFVGSSLARTSVTAVHVHEEGTGRLLFDVPIVTPTGPPFVITQVFTRQPYTGAVNWDELYDLIGRERAYVDVHTTEHPEGQLRGALRLEQPNWQTFTHAFCS